MSVSEIDRIKDDIEVIKEAAGLELPFGWDSVLVNFLLFPGIGLWVLLYWFLSKGPSRYVMGIPILVVMLGAFSYLRFKYRKRTGQAVIKRQEHNLNLIELIVISPIMLVYFIWARHAGYNTAFLAAGICLVLGITHIVAALHLKGRLYWLGGGIPVALFGVALLIWQSPTAVVLNSAIFSCVIGLAMGGIQAYQLKQVKLTNAD